MRSSLSHIYAVLHNTLDLILGGLTGRHRAVAVMRSIPDPQGEQRTKASFPYLVVRIFYGAYQREQIQIRVGPAAVGIANRQCHVQLPSPYAADGQLSAECRELLLSGVQHAVRGLDCRMCVVWSEASCTYVESDKRVESVNVPSGGVLPIDVKFAAGTYFPPTHPR